jgi:molybdopterin-guanine dinucleotide biosynthesis protein A
MTKPFSASPGTGVCGVVLAGGRSRRMNGRDKTQLIWQGTTLLELVARRVQPQVDQLVISANQPVSPFAQGPTPPLIPDAEPDHAGPLAGIVSAMQWLDQTPAPPVWLATFAADTPFVPHNFVAQCLDEAEQNGASVVFGTSAARIHYTMALWRMTLLPHLHKQLLAGERALKVVASTCRAQTSNFEQQNGLDPFFNINTPDDWLMAQRYL